MQTAQIIDFDLALIAQRIKSNFSNEQGADMQAATLQERKQAARKAIAEDLALVQANPPAEGFQAWVKGNCPFSVKGAYRYIEDFEYVNTPPTHRPRSRRVAGRRGQASRRLTSASTCWTKWPCCLAAGGLMALAVTSWSAPALRGSATSGTQSMGQKSRHARQ
jgi:hypothetical protein